MPRLFGFLGRTPFLSPLGRPVSSVHVFAVHDNTHCLDICLSLERITRVVGWREDLWAAVMLVAFCQLFTDAFRLHPTNHTAGGLGSWQILRLSLRCCLFVAQPANDNEKKFPSLFPFPEQDGRLCSSSFSKFIDFSFSSSFKLSVSPIIIFFLPPHRLPASSARHADLAGPFGGFTRLACSE